MRNRGIRGASVVVLVGSLFAAGCASGLKLEPAAVGRMGVFVETREPALEYPVPPNRQQTVASSRYAAAPDPRAVVLLPLLPFYLGWVAIDAALTYRSAAEVATADSALKTAFADAKMPEALRNRLGELIQDRTGRAPLLLAERSDSRSLADQGVQTVLELEIPAVRLEDNGSSIGNPALDMIMSMRFRVVDVATGNELMRSERSCCPIGGGKFFSLAEHDAKRFRELLDRAVEVSAEVVMKGMF